MTPADDFCYIDIGSIDNKNQKLSDEENIITANKAPSRARKIVAIGDILYSTVRPYLHNMCVVDRSFSHQPIASTGFAALTCHTGFYNEFLFYYLMSPDFDAYANDTDNAKGIAYPAINDNKLYRALIPVPPESEQKRIVEKIKEALPYVATYGVAYSETESLNNTFPDRLKKSILQEAVQGKLVPQDPADEPASILLERIRAEKEQLIKTGKIKPDKHKSVIFRRDNSHYEKLDGIECCIDDEIPFEIPGSWVWERWGSISQSIQYGYNAPAKDCGRIKMVRISDIQDNSVLWETVPYCDIKENEISTYLLQPNDILFARTGGTVGKSYLVQEVPEEAIYAGYLIRTRYSQWLCPQYLKFFMESELYWSQLRNGTIATAQPNCNGKTLGKMLLPIPPLSEQYRIVERVNALFDYCNSI
ncbi:restriction endonuclease subunit S [Coprococcus sp. AF21-14LB]|uniref:restriction endonuclease subunit S n=1 Tax=Coprococcus sp. AF21-14LB TaxID=2292231 RepID=UPI000E4FD428|nr:restriction endonuclease subunit S [Coprococcus sp. AF21-14LB]RGS82126.1 restriction endonuclease subunit S [Coprococcus sp. AF21-14LB]